MLYNPRQDETLAKFKLNIVNMEKQCFFSTDVYSERMTSVEPVDMILIPNVALTSGRVENRFFLEINGCNNQVLSMFCPDISTNWKGLTNSMDATKNLFMNLYFL